MGYWGDSKDEDEGFPDPNHCAPRVVYVDRVPAPNREHRSSGGGIGGFCQKHNVDGTCPYCPEERRSAALSNAETIARESKETHNLAFLIAGGKPTEEAERLAQTVVNLVRDRDPEQAALIRKELMRIAGAFQRPR